MRTVLALLLCASAVLAYGKSPSKSETTVFENGFFFITEPTVFDNIYIGVGAIVLLNADILVTGDIEVTGGAWLSASGLTVLGDVEFEGAAIADLEHSTVFGDVEVTHTGGEAVLGLLPTIFVIDNWIGRDLEVRNNNVRSINVIDNRIHGKLELRNNVADFSTISNNLTHVKKPKKTDR